MTFEFDLEVRPEFELPQWKGLYVEKPVREFGDDGRRQAVGAAFWRSHGRLVPLDGPAEPGDYITLNLTFKNGDGRALQRPRRK